MKRNHLIIVAALAVVIFACGCGSISYALTGFGPAASGSTAVTTFTVAPGESDAQVQTDLQKAGLISNGFAFKMLLKFRYSNAGFQAGVYHLSPGMSMDEIIQTLIQGEKAQQIAILIPPGLRIEQYPALFQGKLPLFDSKAFLQIAKTGKYADGSTVTSKYWFVAPKQQHTVNALEGYLLPNTYNFTTKDDAQEVINRLLDVLGENLCPGPSGNPTQYIHDQAQCKAHASQIDGTSVFTLLEKNYFTTNDTQALYDALTLASITMREISHSKPDAAKVASLYYNRWLESQGKLAQPADPYQQGGTDVVDYLGADPTAMYGRDTDSPPSGGKYWQPLQGTAQDTDPNNAYNTNNPYHKGLPPGPISGPVWDWVTYAIAPTTYRDPSAATSYFFFFTTCVNGSTSVYYANTYTQTLQQQNQYGVTTC